MRILVLILSHSSPGQALMEGARIAELGTSALWSRDVLTLVAA